MDFNTGVDSFFLAQLLKASAQRFKPLVVDNIREYRITLLVEIVSVLLGQHALVGTQGVQCACDIHVYSFID